MLIRFLREQADRCRQAAKRMDDPEFARELLRIGRELEQEADEIESGNRTREQPPRHPL
jgi:hypothetical protein